MELELRPTTSDGVDDLLSSMAGVDLPAGSRVVPGYKSLLAAAPDGRIFALKFGRGGDKVGELAPWLAGRGYLAVKSRHVGRAEYVHRLVALAFIENPKNLPQVNHVDGDKTNNRVENLEWCDGFHNQQHAIATGLRRRDCHASVSEETARAIKAALALSAHAYGYQRKIQREFGVSRGVVQGIALGKTWRHV